MFVDAVLNLPLHLFEHRDFLLLGNLGRFLVNQKTDQLVQILHDFIKRFLGLDQLVLIQQLNDFSHFPSDQLLARLLEGLDQPIRFLWILLANPIGDLRQLPFQFDHLSLDQFLPCPKLRTLIFTQFGSSRRGLFLSE